MTDAANLSPAPDGLGNDDTPSGACRSKSACRPPTTARQVGSRKSTGSLAKTKTGGHAARLIGDACAPAGTATVESERVVPHTPPVHGYAI